MGGVLNPSQFATLLGLLSDDVLEKVPLEVLCQRLNAAFAKAEAFKVGTAILQLLRNPDLLGKHTTAARLAGLVYLHDLYKTDAVADNPFIGVFGRVMQTPTAGAKGSFLQVLFHMLHRFST